MTSQIYNNVAFIQLTPSHMLKNIRIKTSI